jgi:hypothetical protein
MTTDDDAMTRAVAGALRDAIHAHGPITLKGITSATKRIVGSLRNAGLDGQTASRKADHAPTKPRKPPTEQETRRAIALRLFVAAAEMPFVLVRADLMAKLAPTRPELHVTTFVDSAADMLGVRTELEELRGNRPSRRKRDVE